MLVVLSGCLPSKVSEEEIEAPESISVTTKDTVAHKTGTVSLDLPKAPKQIDSINTYDLDLEFVLGRIIDNANLDPAFGYIEKEDYEAWVEKIEENDVKRDVLLPLYAKIETLIQIENEVTSGNPFEDATYRDAFVAFHNQLVVAETNLWERAERGELLDDQYTAYEHLFSGYWIYLETAYNTYSGKVTFSNKNEAREFWGTLWEYQEYYMGGGADK